MKIAAKIASLMLALVFAAGLLAGALVRNGYAEQFRDSIDAPPSHRFLLGTDELGRDRFARLLYGTRVSLMLAPCAALLSTLLAGFIGGLAGFLGRRSDRLLMTITDLFLALPWLFLLLTIRALLPLNVSPAASVSITFLLLGSLGWAQSARLVRTAAREIAGSAFLLQAQVNGISKARLFYRHLAPNLRSVLFAQFWLSVPMFIIGEANLGLLGLGVAEPLPSWGSMLRELENYTAVLAHPWMLAPAVVMIAVVSCFQLALRSGPRTC